MSEKTGAAAITAPSLWQATRRGLCPRCGARSLFHGMISLSPRCPACGLDFAAFNIGDGPAALLILFAGAVITTAAIIIELTIAPPVWVHILLWPPVTTIIVVGALRFIKAALLALEYRDGRIEAPTSEGE